jgi:hypothetical protein
MAKIELTQIRSATGFLVLALGLGLAACSSGSTGGTPTDTGGSIGCATDPRVETMTANLTKKGDGGKLSFVIAKADFVPPAAETNTWTLKVIDANGQPVKDAMLTFPKDNHPSDPWMPDHGHGGTPASYKNNGDGTYTVSPLYFFMDGVWSTKVTAAVGSTTDSTTFTFCVGG